MKELTKDVVPEFFHAADTGGVVVSTAIHVPRPVRPDTHRRVEYRVQQQVPMKGSLIAATRCAPLRIVPATGSSNQGLQSAMA